MDIGELAYSVFSRLGGEKFVSSDGILEVSKDIDLSKCADESKKLMGRILSLYVHLNQNGGFIDNFEPNGWAIENSTKTELVTSINFTLLPKEVSVYYSVGRYKNPVESRSEIDKGRVVKLTIGGSGETLYVEMRDYYGTGRVDYVFIKKTKRNEVSSLELRTLHSISMHNQDATRSFFVRAQSLEEFQKVYGGLRKLVEQYIGKAYILKTD